MESSLRISTLNKLACLIKNYIEDKVSPDYMESEIEDARNEIGAACIYDLEKHMGRPSSWLDSLKIGEMRAGNFHVRKPSQDCVYILDEDNNPHHWHLLRWQRGFWTCVSEDEKES
jgi:hypothetical protein